MPTPVSAARTLAFALSSAATAPPPRLSRTVARTAAGSGGLRRDIEHRELVAVGIAEIAEIIAELRVAAITGSAFVTRAELERLRVERIDLVGRVHHQRDHVAVARMGRLFVVGAGDHHSR